MMATIEKRDGVVVVSVNADTLDAGNEKRFKQEVIPALEAGSKVVLDLGAVDFIDSSGLGAILSCYRHLNMSGGDLKICRITKPVQTLFELVRMHRVIDIFPALDEAVSAFGA